MSPNDRIYKASAPGSLMLLGEYAVLYNKPALVCAVNKRMTVTLTPRSDDVIKIVSEGYAEWQGRISELSVTPPFTFVSACLLHYQNVLKTGCELHISSEFSDQIGFGSSAAVTVATLRVLQAWQQIKFHPLDLIHDARLIIQGVQGVGSGADVAASVTGGILAYRANPIDIETFSLSLPLTVIYSGSKTPTVEAIKRVKEKFAHAPELFNTICRAIHQCAKEGIFAVQEANLQRLGDAMNVQQGLMQALGVSTPILDDLIERLRSDSAMLGAKISGSGYGDCVLGLGKADHLGVEERYTGVKQIEVEIATQGVSLE